MKIDWTLRFVLFGFIMMTWMTDGGGGGGGGGGVSSLELVELGVPAHVPLGARAQLACRWQLAPADVLYSVKWYKDGEEFFRHVPRDLEPRRKFLLPGVDVEESDPSGSKLTLAPVTLASEGRYRCEVSGERPLFPTVSHHADMMVIVLPDHGPILTGFRPRYRIGDPVRVSCHAGRSRPATTLTWYVNGEPAASAAVLQVVRKESNGLETSSLQLTFVVTEQHFTEGGLKVKCLATLAPIYWRSNEECAMTERAHATPAVKRFVAEGTRADRVQSRGQPVKSEFSTLAACACYVLFSRV